MSAEFYIIFENIDWYHTNKDRIKNKTMSLDTFIYNNDNEFWLKEEKNQSDSLCFDVRLFFYDEYILLEITIHTINIEKSLKELFDWIRLNTAVKIQDEDDNISNW